MGARGTNNRNGKASEPGVAADSAEAAEEAGLRYVNDERPGYSRRAKGKDFEYLDTEGRPIRDEQRLLRIKRLAIPPAWTDVWICPSANGHVQATGRDARGRNSTAITSAGAKSATKTSSTDSRSLPKRCQIFVAELVGT